LLELTRGPREHDRDAAVRLEHECRCGACEADDEGALGERRLLVDPGPVLDTGAAGDLRRECLVEVEFASARAREELDRAVVVGRAEPARADEEVVAEPVADRRLELRRRVADDPDLRRLDPVREQRAREEGTVEVGAVAADELGAGDDDSGARARRQAGCPRQPPGVTVRTHGRYPATWTRLPATVMTRFSGAPTFSQKRLPLKACVSPRSSVPSKRIFPVALVRLTITFEGPLTAVSSR